MGEADPQVPGLQQPWNLHGDVSPLRFQTGRCINTLHPPPPPPSREPVPAKAVASYSLTLPLPASALTSPQPFSASFSFRRAFLD